ncbi:MAG TPA: DinB family protein [Pirellulales bacterium]|jgi:hypothetical protein
MRQAEIAWCEIDAARRYSLSTLADVDERDWFRQPTEGVTHIAWQVGHLAAAQYSLGLVRLRGERAGDASFVPPEFLALFIRGSTPDPDSAKNPQPSQILAALERVHNEVRAEISRHTDEQLHETQLGKPHPLFSTKLGGLFWCARHEMLHAGQIGLLKRLFGQPAKW